MFSKKISELVPLIRESKLSALELYEECARRIKLTKTLNHFISDTSAFASSAAQAIDQRIKESSNDDNSQKELLGIPVAVKDNFSTRGIRTTCASRMLHNYIPPYNATVVQQLLDHDSLLVGKTNMDEFAMGCGSTDGAFGAVKNPWGLLDKLKKDETACKDDALGSDASDLHDVFHVAGGSSGGSAVAVAVGAAFIGIGSDTGGSTRNPASHCGVVGLKPSYGRCSRHGLIPLVNSMDVPGIITRTVDDAATVLNCLSAHDPKDSTTLRHSYQPISLPQHPSVHALTIGIPKEYHCPGLDASILQAWRKKADEFEEGGAKVINVSMPHTQLSINCYHVLCAAEVASNMARYDGLRYGERGYDESSTEALYSTTRRKNFNDVVRSRILAGNFFLLKNNYHKYYTRAQKIRRLIAQDFQKVYQSGVDLLLTPTVICPAPPYHSFSLADNRTRTAEQDLFTQPVNMAGVPAINVPVSLSEHGMPIGLQLIGQNLREDQLLLAAKFMELNSNFPLLVHHDFFKT